MNQATNKVSRGAYMGIWKKIKAWVFGVELISRDDLVDAVQVMVDNIDYDEDGMISVDEVLAIFKRLVK